MAAPVHIDVLLQRIKDATTVAVLTSQVINLVVTKDYQVKPARATEIPQLQTAIREWYITGRGSVDGAPNPRLAAASDIAVIMGAKSAFDLIENAFVPIDPSTNKRMTWQAWDNAPQQTRNLYVAAYRANVLRIVGGTAQQVAVAANVINVVAVLAAIEAASSCVMLESAMLQLHFSANNTIDPRISEFDRERIKTSIDIWIVSNHIIARGINANLAFQIASVMKLQVKGGDDDERLADVLQQLDIDPFPSPVFPPPSHLPPLTSPTAASSSPSGPGFLSNAASVVGSGLASTGSALINGTMNAIQSQAAASLAASALAVASSAGTAIHGLVKPAAFKQSEAATKALALLSQAVEAMKLLPHEEKNAANAQALALFTQFQADINALTLSLGGMSLGAGAAGSGTAQGINSVAWVALVYASC